MIVARDEGGLHPVPLHSLADDLDSIDPRFPREMAAAADESGTRRRGGRWPARAKAPTSEAVLRRMEQAVASEQEAALSGAAKRQQSKAPTFDESVARLLRQRDEQLEQGEDIGGGPDPRDVRAWREEKQHLRVEGKRRCPKCRAVKPLEVFKDQVYCPPCKAEYNRTIYDRMPAVEARRAALKPSPAKETAGLVVEPPADNVVVAASTSREVVELLEGLRGMRQRDDFQRTEIARLRSERDQAVAERDQLLVELRRAVRP